MFSSGDEEITGDTEKENQSLLSLALTAKEFRLVPLLSLALTAKGFRLVPLNGPYNRANSLFVKGKIFD